MRDRMTRRRALIGTGTLAAATTVGIVATSDNATATVSGEFNVQNGETVLADAVLEDVRLSCDVDWQFSANAPMHAVELELHVGASADTLDMIARYEDTDLGTDDLAGEDTLSGSLMSADDFSIRDFRPDGGELRRTVVAELRFYALRNGEVAAEARQTATFDVVVKDEELQVDMTLGGEGTVSFETG